MPQFHCFSRLRAVVAICSVMAAPDLGMAQILAADYTVTVPDPPGQVIRVRAEFRNLREPTLQLALPTWTPGYYTQEYYAQYIRGFAVTDSSGNRLPVRLSAIQTWTVDTQGQNSIAVEFDYRATVLAVNQAYLTSTYGFFSGTQLFLEPVGHRNGRFRVKFVLPEGWRIATALDETPNPTVFSAPDYDTLVDAPTWVGAVDLYQFEAAGRPHFLAIDPNRNLVSGELKAFADKLSRVVEVQAAIFGGLPYQKYMIFQVPGGDNSGVIDALEHGNSYVGISSANAPPPFSDGLLWGAAHEIFHLWNVKRIRPAELWPYDYSRPTPTPSLWFAEGVTAYMALITMLRAGAWDEEGFLERVPKAPAHAFLSEAEFTSPSDASMATFRAYMREPVSYYLSGNLLGVLLDLSILHDTRGERRLDDVFRRLWTDFYAEGRGFSPEELEQTISSVAGRSYEEFFRKYVNGTEEPPAEEAFAYAGYMVRRNVEEIGENIVFGAFVDGGFLVGEPTSTVPGIRSGDLIIATDGTPGVPWQPGGQASWVRSRGGMQLVLTIRRGVEELTVPVTIPRSRQITDSLVSISSVTEEQLAVRRAWLSTTSR